MTKAKILVKYQSLLAAIGLGLVTLAVFWPVGNYKFIDYDDNTFITQNHWVNCGFSRAGIVWAFTDSMGYWHPLTWLSHMLDCQLFDLDAGRHHIINLLFHIADTLLLFAVLNAMTGALWRSAFVAAAFALHPLHVESVAWIAERKDVLSAFFWMTAILLYVYYIKRGSVLLYFLSLLSFALGLMAKPMIMTLPFVLLLLDYWPLGRFQHGRGLTETGEKTGEPSMPHPKVDSIRSLILEKVPFFVFSIISIYLSLSSMKRLSSAISIGHMSMKLRVENALVSYIKYICKLVWPADLAVFYPLPKTIPLWQSLGALFILFCLLLVIIRLWKTKPYVAVGGLWFLGTMVPATGLVQAGIWPAIADRFTYIPSIGVFIVVAWGAADIFSSWRHRKILPAAVSAIAIVILSICTSLQLRYWRNDITLYEHTVAATNNNFLFWNKLGYVFVEQKNFEQALHCYNEAIKANPNYAEAYSNLGAVYSKLGRNAEAADALKYALALAPDNAKAYCNLGIAYNNLGLYSEAIQALKRSLELKPDNAEAYNSLGVSYVQLGRSQEAMAAYRQAIKIKPDYISAHYNLGLTYLAAGDKDSATAEYEILKTLDTEKANNLLALIQK